MLSRGLMHVNGKMSISSAGALRVLRTRPTFLATTDIGVSTIANIQPDIVELFPSWTQIAFALQQIGKGKRGANSGGQTKILDRLSYFEYGLLRR
jgi:hypothetical protein